MTISLFPNSEPMEYRPRPGSTAALIESADLPVSLADIELSSPEIACWRTTSDPRKALALVRLHSHPVGVTVLDPAHGTNWTSHADEVFTLMRDAINAHLSADGLPAAEHADDLIGRPESARCQLDRANVQRNAPMISVVIATRERPESLAACLDAVLAVDYPSFEVIVVDNDPDTAHTAELIADRFHDRVQYVRENRRGLASAHNCGLSLAHGQLVAFVDDDVIVDRNWLTAIAEGFASADGVGCVTGLILPAELETTAQLLLERHGGFDKGFTQRIVDTAHRRPADPLFPFTTGQLGSGANMSFDTALLRANGGFDPYIGAGTYARGGDDLSAIFRTLTAGRPVVYQPSAVVWHRHHRDMAALHNQAYGYGVGLGAYLTSVLVRQPRMIGPLLRRLPGGIRHAFSASSDRNRNRYNGGPDDLARREKRGLLYGPIAYAVSRWRARPSTKAS